MLLLAAAMYAAPAAVVVAVAKKENSKLTSTMRCSIRMMVAGGVAAGGVAVPKLGALSENLTVADLRKIQHIHTCQDGPPGAARMPRCAVTLGGVGGDVGGVVAVEGASGIWVIAG